MKKLHWIMVWVLGLFVLSVLFAIAVKVLQDATVPIYIVAAISGILWAIIVDEFHQKDKLK